jgi:hypothetical protein
VKPRSDARGKHTNRIDAWPIILHNTDNQRRKCVKRPARTFVRGYFVRDYLVNESDVEVMGKMEKGWKRDWVVMSFRDKSRSRRSPLVIPRFFGECKL